MVLATVSMGEANGVGETQQTTVTDYNMGIVDEYNSTPSSSNAIPRGAATGAGYGMEKWTIYYVTAMNDSTTIDNFKVWKSAGTYETAANLYFDDVIVGSYTQPTVSQSSVALTTMPISEPASNVQGSIVANTTYNTYYGVMQYHADVTHPPGSIATLTITFQYDES